MAYLLDADVFIRAKNDHYGLDFCPAFWDWLVIQNAAGRVFSVAEVGAQLRRGNDELANWARDRGPSFFRQADAATIDALGKVSDWATRQRYTQGAVSEFLAEADYYLIGEGLASGDTVVTHEVSSKGTAKIKIPDACAGLGVTCMNPFEMLRREQARFVLE